MKNCHMYIKIFPPLINNDNDNNDGDYFWIIFMQKMCVLQAILKCEHVYNGESYVKWKNSFSMYRQDYPFVYIYI